MTTRSIADILNAPSTSFANYPSFRPLQGLSDTTIQRIVRAVQKGGGHMALERELRNILAGDQLGVGPGGPGPGIVRASMLATHAKDSGLVRREDDPTPIQQDAISEIFGERPELAFLGNLGESGLAPRGQELFRRRTSDFLNRFQTAVGQQLVSGQLPTLTPESFFGKINFQNEFLRLPPGERGVSSGKFAPPTMFRF